MKGADPMGRPHPNPAVAGEQPKGFRREPARQGNLETQALARLFRQLSTERPANAGDTACAIQHCRRRYLAAELRLRYHQA